MARIMDRLEKVLRAAILLLLSTMPLVVVLGIVVRYILLVSIPWTEELARYLMIWTGFIAFGVAYRKKELIYDVILINKLPFKIIERISFISDVLCSFFLVLAVTYGWRLCLANAAQVSPAARIPMSVIYAAIPLGCALCLVFILESMINFLKKRGAGG